MRGKRVNSETVQAAFNRFLEDETHLVLGFEKGQHGVSHRVFKGKVEALSLVNPVFSGNGALYVRRLFAKGARIVLMLRPCEVRAYVELQKLAQMEREDIIAVSIDCPGAVSSKEQEGEAPFSGDLAPDAFKEDGAGRLACVTCGERRGVVGDAGLRIARDGSLWTIPYTDRGEEFLSLFENEAEETSDPMLLEEPAPASAEPFQTDMETFAQDFAKCILCKNCKNMCPVCYCVDCVFNGDDYLPKGDALLNKIFRMGSIDLPQGKELFHLIRMFHVSQTCVGCGACEEACPQSIPLTKYFKGTSERLQGLFSYMSGRSLDETIPYVTFLEDELKDAED
jgi:formate dehydrogenase subunit beta